MLLSRQDETHDGKAANGPPWLPQFPLLGPCWGTAAAMPVRRAAAAIVCFMAGGGWRVEEVAVDGRH